MRRAFPVAVVLMLAAALAAPQAPVSAQDPIARAKSLELTTPYVPPPGDALEHHTAGFAKIMCSAVFITGLAPDFAAENVGFFTSPYSERAKVGKPVKTYDFRHPEKFSRDQLRTLRDRLTPPKS